MRKDGGLKMQRAVRCILRLPQNSEAAGEQMRRKVILFLAMSLDGYIADKNGKIDWLTGYDCHKDGDEIYQNFIKDVDTIVMGRKTYQQIVTELCPGQWVYRGRNSYIVTSQPGSSSDDIHFTQEAPGRLIKRLRREKGNNIWICGGANIAQQLIKEDLIDRYHISVVPAILGQGVRLFDTAEKQLTLKFSEAREYNGILDIIYERQPRLQQKGNL